MIFGIGCDILNIERLETEKLTHFIKRSFSLSEQQLYSEKIFNNESGRVFYVAGRFAAKEAVAKAFGTGFRNGLYLSDIEIFNNTLGKPEVHLSEKGQNFLYQLTGSQTARIHLSLSDDYPFVQAFAVIEI